MYCTLRDKAGRARFRAVPVTDYAEDPNGVLLISLSGPQQAVRAVWANLVKHRPGRFIQTTEVLLHADDGDRPLRVDPEERYSSAWVGTTLVVLREELLKQSARCVLGGDAESPSPWFPVALRQVPEMPYRDEWLPQLWQAGIREGLVSELRESTLPVWQVLADRTRWLAILKEMVLRGAVQ